MVMAGGSRPPRAGRIDWARIVDRCADRAIILVEAGVGFGKTSLLEALRAAHVGTVVSLTSRGRDPRIGQDASPTMVVHDASDQASPEPARRIERLAERTQLPHRLVVAARELTGRVRALETLPGAIRVGPADLLLRREQVEAVAGLEAHADPVLAASDGWLAGVLVARDRLSAAANATAEARRISSRPALILPGTVVDDLALGDAGRRAIGLLASLPMFNDRLAREVGFDSIEELRQRGVPILPAGGSWHRIVRPMADWAASGVELPPDLARLAAEELAAWGETLAGVRLMAQTGHPGRAVEMLSAMPSAERAEIDFIGWRDLLSEIPDPALAGSPRVLLDAARAAQPAGRMRDRSALLDRADRIATETDDAPLTRAIAAERLRDLVRDGRMAEAEERARTLLAACPDDERPTRARLLDLLGQARAWELTPESLAEASRMLGAAADLWRAEGDNDARAEVLTTLGYVAHYSLGHHRLAAERLAEAANLPGVSLRQRGLALVARAEVLVNVASEAAPDALDQAEQAAAALHDPRLMAYGCWERARLASQHGDAATATRMVHAAEEHRGDWFEAHTGAYFLADAADLLDRVGIDDLAQAYLARARERGDEAPESVQLAEAAIEARHGDAAAGARALDAALGEGELEPRERWRILLLRAHAALRLSDPRVEELAIEAFAAAAALGLPDLPFRREPAVAAALVGVAAEAGSPSAARLLDRAQALALWTLGDLRLTVGGRRAELPGGHPAALLTLLAVNEQGLTADEAIEALDPEAEPARGRRLLRNALHRLNRATAPVAVVVRSGDALALADGVDVDAWQFERLARRGLSRRDGALARRALAAYRGDLLPSVPYAEWLVGPRDRLRGLRLRCLDLLIGIETDRNPTEALRWLDEAIAADPDDETRYMRAARIAQDEGGQARAIDYVRRAAAIREELG